MKIKIGIIGAIIVLMFASLLVSFMCVRTVDTGEVAVVTQFGEVVGMQGTGLHFKSPAQEYNIIDVTQQQVTADYSTATKDNQSIQQTITAQIVVMPDHAEDLYVKFLGNHIAGIVEPTLSDGFKSATAKYSLEDTIEKRDQLAADMLGVVQTKLEPYGIQVVSIEINDIQLPEEYRAAVERQKVAERELITAQVNQERALVEAETNRIIADSLDERNFTKLFIEKWNGSLPLYMGDGDAMSMLLPTL